MLDIIIKYICTMKGCSELWRSEVSERSSDTCAFTEQGIFSFSNTSINKAAPEIYPKTAHHK